MILYSNKVRCGTASNLSLIVYFCVSGYDFIWLWLVIRRFFWRILNLLDGIEPSKAAQIPLQNLCLLGWSVNFLNAFESCPCLTTDVWIVRFPTVVALQVTTLGKAVEIKLVCYRHFYIVVIWIFNANGTIAWVFNWSYWYILKLKFRWDSVTASMQLVAQYVALQATTLLNVFKTSYFDILYYYFVLLSLSNFRRWNFFEWSWAVFWSFEVTY